jgi:5'-3' exonuclease
MAATAENEDEEFIATSRASGLIYRILEDTGATEYEVWLTGKNNFRFSVYPEYKANRKDLYRPKWEKQVKQFLKDHWQANVSEGCEADDMLGVRQTKDTIICTIDKDLDQVEGQHYSWEIRRLGEVIRAARQYHISAEEGIRFFYYQMLVGDATDNIKGVVGIGPKKAERLLLAAEHTAHVEYGDEAGEYFRAVREAYSNDEEMLMNGQCLWIWKKENDIWRFPEATVS